LSFEVIFWHACCEEAKKCTSFVMPKSKHWNTANPESQSCDSGVTVGDVGFEMLFRF